MSFFAGFDLGGTHLKYGIVNKEGKILLKEKVSSPASIDDLLSLLKNLWQVIKNRTRYDIKAAGFGIPGIFSQREKKIIQSPNYPSLDNFAPFPALSRFIDVPFVVDNDANMAAYGEFKAGRGKGAQSIVLLTIGTGIGSGIILDGKLWRGKSGFAGELGHIIVNPEGEICKCGGRGCFETEVSAPKIVKNYNFLSGREIRITAEDIFHRAQRGEQAARQAFLQAGYYLGIGLASVINLLNPEKILLGGGVMKAEMYLLPSALEEARKRAYQASFKDSAIETAGLDLDAGIIGAALLAKEKRCL